MTMLHLNQGRTIHLKVDMNVQLEIENYFYLLNMALHRITHFKECSLLMLAHHFIESSVHHSIFG